MTMRSFNAHVEGYKIQKRIRDEEMWIQGQYVLSAFETVMSHFGAGLSGKKSQAEYVEKPFTQMEEDKQKEENLTEEEKKRYTEQLFMRLRIMQSNFDKEKKHG